MTPPETPAEEAERVASELAYTREAQRRRHDALVAQINREDAESKRLRELHLGDPAYEKLYSPQAIRRQEWLDRMNDEML